MNVSGRRALAAAPSQRLPHPSTESLPGRLSSLRIYL
jgi:hypothetical protein